MRVIVCSAAVAATLGLHGDGVVMARAQAGDGWIAYDERIWYDSTPTLPADDQWEVVVVRPSGAGWRIVTPREPSSDDFAASFSPDGRSIAYVRGVRDICVISVWGRGPRCFGPGQHPVWSPSGRRIAFFRGQSLWVMRSDGFRQRRLVRGGVEGAPAWSPDDRWIAFRHGRNVSAVGTGGERIRLVVRNAAAPDWSPDGRRIAVHSRDRIVLVKPDGSARRVLGAGTFPVWSPDGRRLAYETRRGHFGVIDADGTRRRPLGAGSGPSWSPDGARLVVRTARALVVVNVARRTRQRVAWVSPEAGRHSWGRG